MPPKAKITREQIIDGALDIVRERGLDALDARGLASRLCCSTQPIFTNFSGMDELRSAVCERSEEIFSEYVRHTMERVDMPKYKASGFGYIKFASDEPELFKLLFMKGGSLAGDGSTEALTRELTELISADSGADEESARIIHCENWIFVHGIAVMSATSAFKFPDEVISRMMTDVYSGLKMKYERSGGQNG